MLTPAAPVYTEACVQRCGYSLAITEAADHASTLCDDGNEESTPALD